MIPPNLERPGLRMELPLVFNLKKGSQGAFHFFWNWTHVFSFKRTLSELEQRINLVQSEPQRPFLLWKNVVITTLPYHPASHLENLTSIAGNAGAQPFSFIDTS